MTMKSTRGGLPGSTKWHGDLSLLLKDDGEEALVIGNWINNL